MSNNIQELLNMLYTDMSMLADGSWSPDTDSCDASLDVLQRIASHLGLTLTDSRDED